MATHTCNENPCHVCHANNPLSQVSRSTISEIPESNLRQWAGMLVGACSVPFMRDNPTYVMPSTELADIIDQFLKSPPTDAAGLYEAWVVIANAHEGVWDEADPEWVKAAERWRDEVFHPSLEAASS